MKTLLYKYLKTIWHNSADFNNQILTSFIESGKRVRVLDIGCNDGVIISQFINSKIKSPIIYGVEIDRQLIKKAKKCGIRAIYANAEKQLPYKTNFFDVVIANQIIEHIVDVDTFTSEIFRVLKPEGYVVISTENLSSWHNIVALFFGWQAFSQHISRKLNIGNPLRINPHNPINLTTTSGMHIKIFTPRGLKELFELYGFNVENTYGAGHYPFPQFISKILSTLDPTHSVFIGLKARKPKK